MSALFLHQGRAKSACESPNCKLCLHHSQRQHQVAVSGGDSSSSFEASVRSALEAISPSIANSRTTGDDNVVVFDSFSSSSSSSRAAMAAVSTSDRRRLSPRDSLRKHVTFDDDRPPPNRGFSIRAPNLFDSDSDDDNDDNVFEQRFYEQQQQQQQQQLLRQQEQEQQQQYTSSPSIQQRPGAPVVSPTKRVLFSSSPPTQQSPINSSVSATSTTKKSPPAAASAARATIVVTEPSPTRDSFGINGGGGGAFDELAASSLAAREVEASGDFPTARAEFQLNPHGSFLDTPSAPATNVLSRSMLIRTHQFKSPPASTSTSAAVATTTTTTTTSSSSTAAVAMSAMPTSSSSLLQSALIVPKSPLRIEASPLRDIDDAALLLHELERARSEQRIALQTGAVQFVAKLASQEQSNVTAATQRALRQAAASASTAISAAASAERDARDDAERRLAAQLAAIDAMRSQATRLAELARQRADAEAAAAAAQLKAEQEAAAAKQRAEREAQEAALRAQQQESVRLKQEAEAKARNDAAAAAAATAAAAAATKAATTTTNSTSASTSTSTTSNADNNRSASISSSATTDRWRQTLKDGRQCLASPEAFQLYERCMATVNRFDLMAGEAAKSPQWPPIKQQYDKRINGRVNIISLDAEQVDKIGKILIETLQEAHAQGASHFAYCVLCLARKIVGRAAQFKGVTAEAFAIADVVAYVTRLLPVFGELVLGALYGECPVAAPIYLLRLRDESDADFLAAQKYRRGPDDQFESEADYKLRQIDYITLFAAILRAGAGAKHAPPTVGSHLDWHALVAPVKPSSSPTSSSGNAPSSSLSGVQIGLGMAWSWLARMFNTPPRRISLVALDAFLHIVGYDIARAYPRQFAKLIAYFKDHYVPLLPSGDADSLSRLATLLIDEQCRKAPLGSDYRSRTNSSNNNVN